MTQTVAAREIHGVTVIVPAYNEQASILTVVEELKSICSKLPMDWEIIVVDDGSTDATEEALRNVSAQVIRHPENRGYGASIKTGVMASRYPWILITDGDGTYPNSEIPGLLESIAHYDMIVGARVGKDVNIPLIRRPAKWLLNKLANYMTSTRIPDLNSGFRLFRKSSYLRFLNLYPDGFSFTTTITLALLCNNHPVKFVPINYFKRAGTSKIRPIRDTYNFFLLVIRTIMYFDPLRVFMPVALFLMAYGLLYACYEIYRYMNITTAATIVLFAGFQTAILGLLADLIVKGRRA